MRLRSGHAACFAYATLCYTPFHMYAVPVPTCRPLSWHLGQLLHLAWIEWASSRTAVWPLTFVAQTCLNCGTRRVPVTISPFTPRLAATVMSSVVPF